MVVRKMSVRSTGIAGIAGIAALALTNRLSDKPVNYCGGGNVTTSLGKLEMVETEQSRRKPENSKRIAFCFLEGIGCV